MQAEAAHALVMPSFAEGLPVVVMEAMAAARPVVSTYIAGIPELVQPGETGWLVPAGDAAVLGAALCALAETPAGPVDGYGGRGPARVLARHDIDREAGRLGVHFAAARSASPARVALLDTGRGLDGPA